MGSDEITDGSVRLRNHGGPPIRP
ncbi:uncharacterized protein G2W53_000026 [Senna tora]|uniref:Uncharacterized protein n=1 Tax=Senna tora TaxID=362788 RepID=A0A835CJ32_9FABA|nr:uncharacterized protein G2W53_000026 [Senna tora]